MEKLLFINMISTGNTAGDGHDCPVEFSFMTCDFDKAGQDGNQIKRILVQPDEKIMPGLRVYAHYPAEITGGSDVKTTLMTVRKIISMATEEGYQIVAFDPDTTFRTLRSNMDRLLNDPNMIDTEEYMDAPKERILSVRSLAKLVLKPEDVGTSFSLEALYLALCGDEKFFKDRKDFDDGVTTRTIYDLTMTVAIFSKLVEAKGFASCKDAIDFVLEETGKHFQFGKYVGQLVEDVFKKDFGYCLWCFRNKDLMEANPALKRELYRIMKQNNKL